MDNRIQIIDLAGITVNKNTIPFDQHSPFVTSGIRVGTPAVTTRGMGEPEMVQIGEWIGKVLNGFENSEVRSAVAAKVRSLGERFPIYSDRLALIPS